MDPKDKMVTAIRAILDLFSFLGMAAGEQAGCLTFIAKYLIVHQPNPAEAEKEFIQKLNDQTVPDNMQPRVAGQNVPKAGGMN